MRIAFVISSLRQGGPVTVLANLTKALAGRGHTCKVFYFDAGEEVRFVCPTERVPFFRPFKFSDYDVIHVNGIRSNYYASIHIPPRQRRHYVVISTVHAYTLEEFSLAYSPVKAYLFNLLFMWSLRRHDCVVALSKNMRQYLTKWIKPEKITWAYNGIDTELIDSVEGTNLGNFFQKGDVRLICNSALVKLKRVDLAIRSLCYLSPHFKLWINGDGPLRRQLESLCMDLHVADRVHFAGQVMNPISYLKQMNVFIQCSMTEGFCLAMAEAAACRLNIVSSDIPGMREKYSDSEVRYFRISSSDEASAQRMAVQIVQANEQKDLGKRVRKKVEDQFSLKQMGLRYEQIFESVLNQVNHRK